MISRTFLGRLPLQLMFTPARVFSVTTIPFHVHTPREPTGLRKEPVTVKELHDIGRANMEQTRVLDYKTIFNLGRSRIYGNFEALVNSNFEIKPTEPAIRESKRVGALGMKVGMTHFWDRWGCHTPCTVIQLDRCQITQIKSVERGDNTNAMQVGMGS